jgi:hypothetical protein
MANLGIMDLLSFAKAGYSPKDVKELLSMEIPEQLNPSEVSKITEQEGAENLAKEPKEDLPPQIDTDNAEDIDYKKLYEEEAEKVKQLQTMNTKQDASNKDPEDPEKAFDDILRSLM